MFYLVIQSKLQHCFISEAAAVKLAEVKSTPKRLVHVATASQPHSADWIKAIPVGQIGYRLDKHSLLIDLAIRFGLKIGQHQYRCDSIIILDSLHPLTCRYSARRIPCHTTLNDIINRALEATGTHSMQESLGLDRGDS